MRSDRLLSVLLLLQTHGRLSAPELARRLEVSTRTIYRDVEALSAAGVPVYAERGRAGGVRLLAGYRTDVTGLTADEATALFAFTGRGAAGDLGLGPALASALRKLLVALPEPHRPDATRARDRVVLDPRGWLRDADDLATLPVIQDAVLTDRRLLLHYRSSDSGSESPDSPGSLDGTERTVDPYGLVSKAGTWYLIAAQQDRPRLFRVSRVRSATVLEQPSRRPSDLDLDALWTRLRAEVEDRGAGLPVRLRVRADRLPMLLRICRPQLTAPAGEPRVHDGWAELTLEFRGPLPARGVLLGFGTEVEVLAPDTVRAEFGRTAAELARLYGGH